MRIAFRAAGYEIFTCFFFLCLLKSRIGRGSTADPAGSRGKLNKRKLLKNGRSLQKRPLTEGSDPKFREMCFYPEGFRVE